MATKNEKANIAVIRIRCNYLLYFKLFARNLKNQIGNMIYFHTFQTRSHFSIRANSWHNKKSYLQNLPSKGLNEWWFIYVTLLKIQNKMKLLPPRKLWSYPVKNKTDNYIKINFCWNIVIRNGKIVWKHGAYCWYFRLNLKHLGWPYRVYIKTAKNGDFC